MKFSTILATSSLASVGMGLSLPSFWTRATVTVSSDTGTADIEVPATTDAGGDVGGKADAASAVAGVINQVVQLVQGIVDGDIKVSLLLFFPSSIFYSSSLTFLSLPTYIHLPRYIWERWENMIEGENHLGEKKMLPNHRRISKY